MLLATQVASSVAGVLLVIPMYLLGRMLFGRFAGFAGAALFQLLPVPAHVTADGLTEALYLLCAVSAVGSWPAASTPCLWLRGTSIRGPLIGMTSSMNTAMFIARGSAMPSSRAQVP